MRENIDKIPNFFILEIVSMREGRHRFQEDHRKLTIFQDELAVLNTTIQKTLSHFGHQCVSGCHNPTVNKTAIHLQCLLKKMRDALCASSPTLQDHSANESLKKVLKILHDQQQLRDEAVQRLMTRWMSLDSRSYCFYEKLYDAEALQMKIDAVIGELLDQQQLR